MKLWHLLVAAFAGAGLWGLAARLVSLRPRRRAPEVHADPVEAADTHERHLEQLVEIEQEQRAVAHAAAADVAEELAVRVDAHAAAVARGATPAEQFDAAFGDGEGGAL